MFGHDIKNSTAFEMRKFGIAIVTEFIKKTSEIVIILSLYWRKLLHFCHNMDFVVFCRKSSCKCLGSLVDYKHGNYVNVF